MAPGAPGWVRLLSILWLLIFAGMPWLNRDRARIGDLVAGTLVVRAPEAVLLEDVAGARRRDRQPAHVFRDAQLGIYGVYELQVLEDVLRRGRPEEVARVAAQVAKKIGAGSRISDPERFLHDFYAAMRGRQERDLLLGKRRADKHAKP